MCCFLSPPGIDQPIKQFDLISKHEQRTTQDLAMTFLEQCQVEKVCQYQGVDIAGTAETTSKGAEQLLAN